MKAVHRGCALLHMEGTEDDCTTRALAYCMEGRLTYDEARKEQDALAERLGLPFNADAVLDRLLRSRGYVAIALDRKIRRSRLSAMVSGSIGRPMVTHSRGHVAVVDADGVHDSFDSRGGMCDVIYADREDGLHVHSMLVELGYGGVLYNRLRDM